MGRADIYNMHATEAIEYWVNLLDRWSLIPGKTGIDYGEVLEKKFRNYRLFDYWRLVFLIEAVNPDFLQDHIDPNGFWIAKRPESYGEETQYG